MDRSTMQPRKPQEIVVDTEVPSGVIGCGRPVEAHFTPDSHLQVALLTGGQDRHYAVGLAMALVAQNVGLDVIGNIWIDGPEMHNTPGLRFLELYSNPQSGSRAQKITSLARSYWQLMRYVAIAEVQILHILWNHRLELFDRTLLMLYFKLLGKKLALTAHNVNAGKRDAKDSVLNHLTLKMQYKLADKIFVHTEKMKNELIEQFQIAPAAVTIIPYGVNNAIPCSDLTREAARLQIGLGKEEKAILFFGAVKRYKGLEYLVSAFQQIASQRHDLRLVIAGERKKGHDEYLDAIQKTIEQSAVRERIIQKIDFIRDEEVEVYFKAADVAVLPYTEIYQSGILFLTYSFGLPVIATDVGSFREDVVEGRTGFVCRPRDSADLAATIERYFSSELFRTLEERRQDIREFVYSEHSWDAVGTLTRSAYSNLLAASGV